VGNLLDMSRVTTGTVEALLRPVGMDEVVPAALRSLGGRVESKAVELDVPETLPRVRADPALFERAVANLIDNAVAWSPAGAHVHVGATAVNGRVDLRITDRGPGIPVAERARMFLPFQRRGDGSNGAGVGLGLAVAKGFVEVMHGRIVAEDTPGGGLTMVVSLPVASTP
jgi:two-component system sensor histidine kinase KdpD